MMIFPIFPSSVFGIDLLGGMLRTAPTGRICGCGWRWTGRHRDSEMSVTGLTGVVRNMYI